ncbi:acetylxylan esterase [candidate division KSB1 bacterium]|nr:acetylxylan esterase [candidate division KSB1 bacterium]
MRTRSLYCAICLCFGLASLPSAQVHETKLDDLTTAELRVLAGVDLTRHTLRYHLDSLVSQTWQKWQEDLNANPRTGREKHYEAMKSKFIDAIGGLPQRTPLRAQITGAVARRDYRVEKILFESMTGFFVTGLLFLPDHAAYSPPYPGVLIPCGHHRASKAHDEYQSMAALCALNGMAAFVYDPVDQGERLQFRSDRDADDPTWGTRAHNLNGIRAILLGENIARYEIWDGMAAIDYLQSRPDIDAGRIGVTGNSGGGTQTSQLMALDRRIKVAAPSCYLHHLDSQSKYSMGDAEQNIFGQLRFGMDHADYVLMNAPRPVLILAATRDFFRIEAVWETFRYLKRFYTDIGYAENVDILENDAGHNYNRTQRQGAVRWLARHLLDEQKHIVEPDLELLSVAETTVTPSGRALQLPGAKTLHDLQMERMPECDRSRRDFLKHNSAEAVRKKVLELIGCKAFDAIDAARCEMTERLPIETATIEKLIFTTNRGACLPALRFTPLKKPAKRTVLFLSEDGKAFHLQKIKDWLNKDSEVLAVDLSGIGELREKSSKPALSKNIGWDLCFTAYLLGESIVGIRTGEILELIQYIKQTGDDDVPLHLIADGEVAVPALHAAFLAPEAVARLSLTNCLSSWRAVIESEKSFNQMPSMVHGALKYYDLPDLIARLGKKVEMKNARDALGFLPNANAKRQRLPDEPEFRGLAGIRYGSADFKRAEGHDPIESLDLTWSNERDRRGRDWSAEWFGFIRGPVDGPVVFNAATDQSVEVYIDDRPLLIVATGGMQSSATVDMKKDRWYRFKVRFSQDRVDQSRLNLQWSWEGRAADVIGGRYLHYSQKQRFTMDSAIR